ncbi:GPI inositol-deacylase-like isoform X1 [Sinocyclocheilus anshuiensis]|uniref:GPI inositol-deacylase-like isoform X1 n=1 Tax=Sinocyclocheilus anshuiensis TaxID=1608454 RepID=UPI0007B78E2E|nr:PREDICTED: GPI inositol-deacylase-like isoform X1 [Sinocyclocheilus anshuiensis]
MRLAGYAFYGFAIGLLLVGLRDLLFGFGENRCSMTYMFEYPEYRRVQLPRRVARQYPSYGLYLYGEGAYAQENRGLELTGAPVLFLPGNAGSYKQACSLGSVALRKAENLDRRIHMNVFTIDFNEELVALYGGSLRRQTQFLYESIKVILRLYEINYIQTNDLFTTFPWLQDRPDPPTGVALVGHSMGGVVARALFALACFNPRLVSFIITQASPHQAPVLSLDPYILEFYSRVRHRWATSAEDLRNVTVLSVGGGYLDFQVRSGLTALSCPIDDLNKMSVVATAVPRSWVSTDHISIVWCKELVLATVRVFFDLIEPETGQFTESPEKRMSVLNYHFFRHPVLKPGGAQDDPVTFSAPPDAWKEVNTLRLFYSAPKEAQVKYFLFDLSSRRKAYSHFHCRSNNMEMTSWLYGCTQMSGSMCVQAVDLSPQTELLPAYKAVTVKISELLSVSHLIIDASNPSGAQFVVECELQREESLTVSVQVPHVLSFGLTVSDISINSSGLLHTLQLQDFHQVYQAFRITITSHCKTTKDRLPSVYRLRVPWFHEDSFDIASIPSVSEIYSMLHSSRPDNATSALLQLHTAPNCQYKVSIRTSFPKVLGQILRFCGPVLPVYSAVVLLLMIRTQLSSIKRSGHPVGIQEGMSKSLQLHKLEVPILLLLLRQSWFQDVWSSLGLPAVDALPLNSVEDLPQDPKASMQEWPRLVSPLLCVLGASIAFWGSTVLRVFVYFLSFVLAPLHRPSVSRDCGTLRLHSQILLIIFLSVLGGITCGALALMLSSLLHLYRVLRLQMTERSLSHMLNLAPQKVSQKSENGFRASDCHSKVKECNGSPLLSESVLQDVRDDLQLHFSLSTLLTFTMMLSVPSLIHWKHNLRYWIHLDPDPCWPHIVPLLISSVLLISCNTDNLLRSKLMLNLTLHLLLPLCVGMLAFCPLHIYRVTYFLSTALTLLVCSCYF